ncbi:MAG TPA: ATP-binding protein [Miltoncostaeales bacterium]|nr:ATP-binding protein [Miltoncostaeales bacterium]
MVRWRPFTRPRRNITTLLTPHQVPTVLPRRTGRHARFVHYAHPAEPPTVDEVDGSPGDLVDTLFMRVSRCSSLPPVALREVIENLMHADFADACVSVLDGGATVRVSDCGPGIDDKVRALEPGYSTATSQLRAVIRGVGSGLAVCSAAMIAVGGTLDIDDNLEEGTVVTLRAPSTPSPSTPTVTEAEAQDEEISEQARRLLAVIMEVGPATQDVLAAELGSAVSACSRELGVLERRGMVVHEPDGRRSLTDAGTALLTTLF